MRAPRCRYEPFPPLRRVQVMPVFVVTGPRGAERPIEAEDAAAAAREHLVAPHRGRLAETLTPERRRDDDRGSAYTAESRLTRGSVATTWVKPVDP